MSSRPLPPERPKKRRMLDASAQQKVRDRRPAGTGTGGPKAGSSPSSTRAGHPIRIRAKRDRLRWSFGGLTISVRVLAGLAITGILLITLVPLGLQWMKQEQAYRAVVAEVAATEAKNEAMRDQLAEWENEDFIAAQARDRLGYVRPGETQFVVTDAPEKEDEPTHSSAKSAVTGPPKPWMWNLAESLRDADSPPASSSSTSGPSGRAATDDGTAPMSGATVPDGQ